MMMSEERKQQPPPPSFSHTSWCPTGTHILYCAWLVRNGSHNAGVTTSPRQKPHGSKRRKRRFGDLCQPSIVICRFVCMDIKLKRRWTPTSSCSFKSSMDWLYLQPWFSSPRNVPSALLFLSPHIIILFLTSHPSPSLEPSQNHFMHLVERQGKN